MSLELSKSISSINPSATMSMVNKIAQLKTQGIEVISLNVGEPDFDTPIHINQALIEAINQQKTKYVSVNGIIELRQAIKDKLKKDNNLDYDINQICVTTGAKQALYNTVRALANPDDEFILISPCWVSYEEMIKSTGAKVVFVETKDDYQLDLNKIEQAITPKTKAIMINTPNNPTGAVYTKESLLALGNLAIKYDFYIISDEIYEKLIYEDHQHYSIASLDSKIYERTITINGFAKAYAMTGLRLGYVAAPHNIIKLINNLQAHSTSNTTTPVQYAGIAALKQDQTSLTKMINEFDQRRILAFNLLKENSNLIIKPVYGAFYIMLDIAYYFNKQHQDYLIKDANDLSLYLLEQANVALVSGESFQAPNCLRLSYSNSQVNIKQGIEKMNQALKKLK